MPEKWLEEEHAKQRQACGVPEGLVFKTKPEIGLELLFKNALTRDKLPFFWVAADALYGDSPAFRDGVAASGKYYFTAIKETTLIWCTPPKVHAPAWSGHDLSASTGQEGLPSSLPSLRQRCSFHHLNHAILNSQ